MKKTIFTICAMLIAVASFGQVASPADSTATKQATITRDASGNFHEVRTIKATGETQKTTPFTFTASDGSSHPVFEGAKGGLYYYKVSQKTGKRYRVYLPK